MTDVDIRTTTVDLTGTTLTAVTTDTHVHREKSPTEGVLTLASAPASKPERLATGVAPWLERQPRNLSYSQYLAGETFAERTVAKAREDSAALRAASASRLSPARAQAPPQPRVSSPPRVAYEKADSPSRGVSTRLVAGAIPQAGAVSRRVGSPTVNRAAHPGHAHERDSYYPVASSEHATGHARAHAHEHDPRYHIGGGQHVAVPHAHHIGGGQHGQHVTVPIVVPDAESGPVLPVQPRTTGTDPREWLQSGAPTVAPFVRDALASSYESAHAASVAPQPVSPPGQQGLSRPSDESPVDVPHSVFRIRTSEPSNLRFKDLRPARQDKVYLDLSGLETPRNV